MYTFLDLFGNAHFVECAVMAYVAITAEYAFAVANNGFFESRLYRHFMRDVSKQLAYARYHRALSMRVRAFRVRVYAQCSILPPRSLFVNQPYIFLAVIRLNDAKGLLNATLFASLQTKS